MDVNTWLLDYFNQCKTGQKRLIVPNSRKLQVAQIGLSFPGSLFPIQPRSQERVFLNSGFPYRSVVWTV